MAGETYLTMIGNLTADPELRFTTSGAPVASFTIASAPRRLDQATQEWHEDPASFMRCSAWRVLAEHAVESFRRGDRVVAYGRLKQRQYETAEGEKRTVWELDVIDVAASVQYYPVQVKRPARPSEEAAETARHRPATTADPEPVF